MILECLVQKDLNGEVIVFKYPLEKIGKNEGQFYESSIINYAFDNIKDLPLYSNISVGKKVIEIHDLDCKNKFNEQLFEDVYKTFCIAKSKDDIMKFSFDQVDNL